MISQYSVDGLLELRVDPCQAFKRGIEWPKRRAAIITSQDAHIVGQAWKNFGQAPHCAFATLHVQVTDMKYCEAVKLLGQDLATNIIMPDLDLLGVLAAASI